MKLLYFAWLKDKTGVAAEEVAPPAEVTTVAELLAWLGARGPGYAEALADLSAIRVAVNQVYAKPGEFISISRNEIPCCFFGAFASVRTRQKIQSAYCAMVVQIFWPLTR